MHRSAAAPAFGVNLTVLWGPCPAGADIRTLASGRRVASLAVRVPLEVARGGQGTARSGARVTSVPVTVWNPPAWLDSLDADEVVVVVGVLRRRFFVSRAGTRASRVEVEASSIARGTRANRARAARQAATVLADLALQGCADRGRSVLGSPAAAP